MLIVWIVSVRCLTRRRATSESVPAEQDDKFGKNGPLPGTRVARRSFVRDRAGATWWQVDSFEQRQRHGFVIRGGEAARVVRNDEEDHDAVVMKRLADVRKWAVGHEDVDRNLATRLGVDTPRGSRESRGRN